MVRLNDAQRHEAVGMFAGGLPRREIARRMNCAHSTILRLVQRHNETGPMNDRPRPGRQRESRFSSVFIQKNYIPPPLYYHN